MLVEKIARCWLVVSLLAVLGFGAWMLFGGGACWLLDRHRGFGLHQPVIAYALRYQVASEGQHGPVAILADLVPVTVQFEKPFLQSTPDDVMAADLFRGWADDRQRGALVLEVGDERNVNFSLLVSQGHSLNLTMRPLIRRDLNGPVISRWPSRSVKVNPFDLIRVLPSDRKMDFISRSKTENNSSAFLQTASNIGLIHGVQCTASAHFSAQPGRLANGGFPLIFQEVHA